METERILHLATQFAKGAQWPGGALGVLGAMLLVGVTLTEELGDRLTSAEFIAVLTVGAVLAVAGPLVIAFTAGNAQRSAVNSVTAEVTGAAALWTAVFYIEEDRPQAALIGAAGAITAGGAAALGGWVHVWREAQLRRDHQKTPPDAKSMQGSSRGSMTTPPLPAPSNVSAA